MKTIARYFLTAVALGAIGLFTGCATTTKTTARAARATAMTFQMKVIESSSDRQLSPEELKTLRQATIRFLAKQGGSWQGGTFYVRVNFEPTQPGEPGDWVLVQIISQPIDDYSRVVAYRDSSPNYYPGSGSSVYYPDYYYDPYDNSPGGGYFHPAPGYPPPGSKPHDRDNGDKPHDRNRGDQPPGNSPRVDGRGHDRDDRPRTADNPPRSHDTDRGRGRGAGSNEPTTARISDSSSGGSSGSSSGGSSSSSSGSSGGSSSYSPPPASSSSEPSSPVRSESSNSGVQKDSAQKEEN